MSEGYSVQAQTHADPRGRTYFFRTREDALAYSARLRAEHGGGAMRVLVIHSWVDSEGTPRGEVLDAREWSFCHQGFVELK
jgi:hypothetical protein